MWKQLAMAMATAAAMSACGGPETLLATDAREEGLAMGPIGGPGDGPPLCVASPVTLKLTTSATRVQIEMPDECTDQAWTLDQQRGSNPFSKLASGTSLTTYTDRVSPLTSYCYRLTTRVGNHSVVGPTACVTTPPLAPLAPVLGAFQSTTNSISFSIYDNSTNEDSFRVFRRAPNGAWAAVSDLPTRHKGTTGDHYEISDVVADGTGFSYCYIVSARNAGGDGWAPEKCTVLQSSDVAPVEAEQWTFNSHSPWDAGTLWNIPAGAYLQHGDRALGINLVWSDQSTRVVRIERNPRNSNAPIVFGERVAIHFDGGGYLQYGSRTFGINLEWSTPPAYEWEIMSPFPHSRGGEIEAQHFALRNVDYGDFLVYGERSPGINLAWYDDTLAPPAATPTPTPSEQDHTILLYRQAPPNGGPVVYSGSVNFAGQLTRVQVPAALPYLQGMFFLKPGATSADCANAATQDVAGLGAYVPATQRMTEGQKLALWGSATPSTPITFNACAVVAQLSDASQYFLNVSVLAN